MSVGITLPRHREETAPQRVLIPRSRRERINQLVEDGTYPGLEGAIEEAEEAEEAGDTLEERFTEPDPAEVMAQLPPMAQRSLRAIAMDLARVKATLRSDRQATGQRY